MSKLSVVFKITIPEDEGEEYKYLAAENFIIGRSPEVDVCLKDKGVSRNHLKVSSSGKKIFIRDLGSAYGTRVNGTVIPKDEEFLYRPGTPIKVGGWEEPIRIELFHAPISDHDEASLVIQEAQMEAGNMRKKIEHEGQKLRIEAESSAARIVNDAKAKSTRLIEDAKQQNALLEKQIEANARERAIHIETNAKEEAEKILEAAREEVGPLKNQIEGEAVKTAKEILANAENDAEAIRMRAQRDSEITENRARNEAKEITDAAEAKAKMLAESAEQKIENLIEEYQEKGRAYVKEKERVGAEVIRAAESKALQILNDAQMSIDELREQAREDGEEDRRRIELEAHEKAEEIIEKGHKDRAGIIEDANANAKRIADDAREQGRQIIADTHEQNQGAVARLQVLKEQIENIEEEKKSVLKKSELLQEEKRQYELEIEEVRASKEKLKDEVAHAKLETQKQLNSLEAEVRKVEALLRKREIACEEADRARQQHEESTAETIQVKQDVQKMIENLEKNANLQKEKIAKEIDELKGQRDEVAETLDAVRQSYEEKKNKIAEEMQSFREKRSQKLESELSKMRLKAEEEIKNEKEVFALEVENAKRDLEREVNEVRASELDRLEQVKKREEQVMFERKNNHIQEIAHSLDMVIRSRAGKLEKYVNDADVFKQEVYGIVKKVVNQEYDAHQEQLKTIMTFNPEDVKKVKKFWQRMGGVAALIVALVIGHISYPQWPKALMDSLRPDKSAIDVVKEEMQAEQEKNTFKPNLTENFKESYTENILYTNGYLEKERNPEYHDLWIKELNKFVIDDLNLKEEVTVNLVAAESVLLQQLEEQRGKITNKQLKEGIKKLEDIESVSMNKFTDLLKSDANVEKYLKFKGSFYDKFSGKKPASEPYGIAPLPSGMEK